MTLTNRQKIANTLANWDKQRYPVVLEYRFAGYLEALLQFAGKSDTEIDLPYKSFMVKRLIFPGSYEVRETYPELMYRLATEYLIETHNDDQVPPGSIND